MPIVADSMRAYYDRRAPEYDEWWLGNGSFAARDRPGWHGEVAEVIEVIRDMAPSRTLDVACGTGFLTRHLRGDVVGLDQSRTMVEIAEERAPGAGFVCSDAVPLPFGDDSFDTVFTSHFYGHLLPPERAVFLAEAERVGRQLIVVDAALRPDVRAEQWQDRGLRDGTTHSIYKRYFTPPQLNEELGGGDTLYAGRWFVAVAHRWRP